MQLKLATQGTKKLPQTHLRMRRLWCEGEVRGQKNAFNGMGKAGEENPSCAFPSSQRCSHSVCVQGDRALLEARASSRGSPGQAVNPSFSQIFITRGIQLCKMPRILQNSKMLPLLFLWKMSITSLLKSVCSREMFWWFGCFPSERRFCWEITGKVCVVVYDMLLQIAFWNPALYSETGLSW